MNQHESDGQTDVPGATRPSSVETEAARSDTPTADWRRLIVEVVDQLEQWELYLDAPSLDSLPIGGLPQLPGDAVPNEYVSELASIARRIESLGDRLRQRATDVGGEIDQVRKVRVAAATYTS